MFEEKIAKNYSELKTVLLDWKYKLIPEQILTEAPHRKVTDQDGDAREKRDFACVKKIFFFRSYLYRYLDIGFPLESNLSTNFEGMCPFFPPVIQY